VPRGGRGKSRRELTFRLVRRNGGAPVWEVRVGNSGEEMGWTKGGGVAVVGLVIIV